MILVEQSASLEAITPDALALIEVVEVPLSKGRIALIDKRDASLARFKWRYLESRNGRGYAVRSVAGAFLYLHREVLGATSGAQVDHRNGNGLDCRRNNLRVATHAENQQNRGAQRNNTSGYKGVVWDAARSCWRAEIQGGGRRRFLGRFATAEGAAQAYAEAAGVFHGEFMCATSPKGGVL